MADHATAAKAAKKGAARRPSDTGAAEVAAEASTRLDRLIHERVRLGIVAALSVNASLTFNELKALLGATDGNLSVHVRKLEDAGYVACHKGFEGRVPRTDVKLTAAGRRALERYVAHMDALIGALHGK